MKKRFESDIDGRVLSVQSWYGMIRFTVENPLGGFTEVVLTNRQAQRLAIETNRFCRRHKEEEAARGRRGTGYC